MALRLIESGTRKRRGVGSTFASIVIHALIVVGSVIATKHVGEAVAETVEAVTEFVVEEEKKEEPKPEEPPPDVAAPPLAKGFQVLTAPVEIPDVIPEIDLNAKVTNEADFSGRGVAGGLRQPPHRFGDAGRVIEGARRDQRAHQPRRVLVGNGERLGDHGGRVQAVEARQPRHV